MKEKLRWIGAFFKRHLKLIIILILVIAAAAAAASYINKKKSAVATIKDTAVRTAQIEKRTITNSISLTGSVASAQSKTVTTSLANVEVLEVNVEKGDTVEAGDILLTFDTSDIREDITSAKVDLTQSQEAQAIAKQTADRELNYTTDSQLTAAQKAAKAVDDAAADLADACDAYGDAKSSLSQLQDVASGKKSAYEAAQEAYNNLKNNSVSSNTVALSTEDGTVTAEEVAAAQAAVTGAEQEVSAAQAAYEAAKTEYEAAAKNAESADTKVTSAQSAEKNAQKSYESAVQEQESTNKSSVNSILSQQENYAKTMLTLDDETEELEDKLKDYEKELKKYTVTAPIGGTVTEVTAEAGSLPTGEGLVTIEDCQGYTVTAEVDEYDISDISVGMEAVVKTDATGDEELKGVICYVSPTPSDTTSDNSGVTYEIKIDLQTANDRLRLGMTAKISIILESREDVLTVPYNCIQENESGESVIYVPDTPAGGEQAGTDGSGAQAGTDGSGVQAGADESSAQAGADESSAQAGADGSSVQAEKGGAPSSPGRRAVAVEIGLESDYYVEITSAGGEELTEGMAVIVPTDAGDAESSDSREGGGAGGMGGMGQGMPGGGPGGF